MPRIITPANIAERLHELPRDSYALIANVGKGIALGVGGWVLLQIFSQSEWIRLVPWVASMELLAISYGKWNRGALFVNARTNAWDNIIPMLLGVAELLLFAVLTVDTQSYNLGNSKTIWLNWSACVAFHGFLGFAIVQNRLHFLEPRDFHDSLTKLVEEYKGWTRRDRLQTLLVGCIGFAFWLADRIVIRCWGIGWATKIQTGFALLFVLGAWKPITDSSRQQSQIDTYVSGLLKTEEGLQASTIVSQTITPVPNKPTSD